MSLGSDDDDVQTSSSTGTQQSEAERATAERAIADWNDYVTRFTPVQDRFLSDISDLGKSRRRLMADANAEALTQVGPFGRQTADDVARGHRANSGVQLGGNVERASMFRRGLAAAAGTIEPQLYERRARGQLKVAALGRGLADSASTAVSSSARATTAESIQNAMDRISERSSLLDAAAGLGGMYAATKLR